MEKINLPVIYDLGSVLSPLGTMTYDKSRRLDILLKMYHLDTSMTLMFKKFPTLTVCRAKWDEMDSAIAEARAWFRETPTEKMLEADEHADLVFEKVIRMAKEFEIVLSAELQTLATYHITQKGIYSTPDLIERAEGILPEPVLGRISQMAISEVRESGKCLALDCGTASAFHMMRATEEVMHRYYVSVCKPKSAKRLKNWGAYIAELSKSNRAEVKEVVAMLQQIKDRHRNLIMHPEIVLTIDEAFTLFEIAQGAIIAMADNIPASTEKKGK
jgi:hypothetical protein